jgi:ankyrin repeat protein
VLHITLSILLFTGFCWALPNDLNEEFYSAIRGNDLARLRTLVDQKANVNTKDSRGETPLMYAAAVGSVEAMKFLLEQGADANVQNQFGSTALIWSATDLAKVQLLLDHGANPNLASKKGRTALLVAAMSDRSAPIVRLLISKGADIQAKDFLKTTALKAAAFGNDSETVGLLLDAGLDPNAADLPGLTPLMMAAGWNGNLETVKLLLAKGANANAVSRPVMGLPTRIAPSKFGNLTALLMAAPFGPPELIQTLLDAGASVNAKDVRGMTPLMLALATDHQDPAVIRLLLSRGADPQMKDEAGNAALDWANRAGEPAGMELLKTGKGAVETAQPVRSAAPKTAEVRLAVERSVTLIEKSSAEFFARSGCVACHAQSMTDLAVAEARSKGVLTSDKAAEDRFKMLKAIYPPEPFYERFDAAGAQEQLAYPLAGLAALNHDPDRMTDAMVANIAAAQRRNGSWHVGAAARPPAEEGDIFRTAVCVRALAAYAPPGRAAEMQNRVANAREWLRSVKAVTTEDRAMQLLGLHWAGVDAHGLAPLTKAILAEQRADGGWRQRANQATEAYSTGESLYALAAGGGVAPTSKAYRRGLEFLLETQRPDASWYVASRTAKIQAYFEGGFPYKDDQWISSWGTAWAAMALTQALPAEKARVVALNVR